VDVGEIAFTMSPNHTTNQRINLQQTGDENVNVLLLQGIQEIVSKA
jgi:hypothetical protein